eukprot:UN3848
MALKRVTDTQPLLQIISVCRRAWRFVMQPLVETWVEQLLVQILVVVADSVCPWHIRLLALRSRYPCLAVQVSAECVYAYCRRTCLYKSQMSCPPANVGRDARFFSSGT